MANTDDLRYKSTESAIRSAFMKMIREKPLKQISVVDICKQARVSRNAFYMHHAGISSLYDALTDELISKLADECIASTNRVAMSGLYDDLLTHAIFEAFVTHENLLRALIPTDDGSLQKGLAEGLAQIYATSAYDEGVSAFGQVYASREHRLACSFAAWAHIGFVTQWIKETDEPLVNARERFISLQSSVSANHYRFLSGKDDADALQL